MNPSLKKYTPYRLVALALLFSSGLLTSCFGPKKLATQQQQPPHYDFVGDTIDGWALTRQDSLWGFVSADGKRVIKPIFLWATDFADSMALAKDKRGYRYVNHNGKLLRRLKPSNAYSFSEGLAPVKIKDKWGYINHQGKIVIKPQFNWAMPFQENRAQVSVGLRQGYIDKRGQLIIPAIYEESDDFRNGVAIVRKDGQFGLIDTMGNFVLANSYANISPWQNDFYRLDLTTGRSKKYGLADTHGKLLLDTQYTAIDLQAENAILVQKDRLYGLYDSKGCEIIPTQYEQLRIIPDANFIVAKKDGHWGFLDRQGKVLLPFEDQLPLSANDGRIWIQRDSLYLLFDNEFREIRRFSTYNNVYAFSNGYAAVSVSDTSHYYGDLYGYIDREGNEAFAPQFDGTAGYVNPYGISVVGIKSYGVVRHRLFNIKEGRLVDANEYSNLEKFGPLWFNTYGNFIDSKTGKPIHDFPYQSITRLTGDDRNLAVARREGKAALIDTSLNVLMPLAYDDMSAFHHGRMAIRKNGLRGFADEKYRIRIPMQYDDVHYFQYERLTVVTKDKKKGVIGRYGREIIPLQYTSISFDPGCDRVYAKKSDGIDIYNRAGRLLQTTAYEYIGFYGRKPYVAFRQHGKMGFMGYDFETLHEPEFDRVGSFYDGLAWVTLHGKGGYVNEAFQSVIPIQFDAIEDFANGFASVRREGRQFYINTQGDEVVLTEEERNERDDELERRKEGWIDFSS